MTLQEKLDLIRQYGKEETYNLEEIDGVWYVSDGYDFSNALPLEDVHVLGDTDFGHCLLVEDLDDWFRCDDCGIWMNENSTYNATDCGNTYCDDCIHNNADWCEYHEEWEEDVEMFEVHTNYGIQMWCENAVNDSGDCYECNHCNEIFAYNYNHGGSAWRYGDEHEYCEDCYYDHTYYCDRCGDRVHEDNWDDEYDCCDDCASSIDRPSPIIKSYHNSKEKFKNLKFGKSKHVEFAGVGFELEIDKDDYDGQHEMLTKLVEDFGDRLAFERDGSLSSYGVEIISAPHTKDEFYKVDWTSMLETIKDHGYVSHDAGTCGLHVHISFNMFGGNNERRLNNLMKLHYFYEKYYNEFVKLSRRRDNQLRWGKNTDCIVDDLETTKSRIKETILFPCDRYMALNYRNQNTMNYDVIGEGFDSRRQYYPLTVEFRLNRGTINPQTFYAIFDIIFNLVRNSRKIEWTEESLNDVKKWFSGCKRETYEYINKRHAFDGVFYTLPNENETEQFESEEE